MNQSFVHSFQRYDTLHAAPTPLGANERISIIDTLRGVAILGILLMNIPGFGMPYQYYFNLELRNEYTGANYYTWWVINGFFEGTMRALFSMLFGAGAVLLLSRLEKKSGELSPADFYYRRLIWLLIFGVINAFVFLWPGDILYAYALCGLFLYPFRNWKAKHLLLLGFAIMLVATFKTTSDWAEMRKTRLKGEKVLALEKQKQKLTETQKEEKAKWEGLKEKMSKEHLIKEAHKDQQKVLQKNYFKVQSFFADINKMIQSKIMYNEYFWDILAFFFIGMAFFKTGVLTGARSVNFYWMMLLLGYGIGIAYNYWSLRTMIHIKFDMTYAFEKMGINFYQLRRWLVACGHIGLVMIFYKYGIMKWLQRALAKVGQMAFTNYLVQSILCAIIFYGFGGGFYGKLQRYELYYIVLAIWIFQIIFSNIWLRYYKFGPFEWLWRSLTYWKKQPN